MALLFLYNKHRKGKSEENQVGLAREVGYGVVIAAE